MLKHFNGLSTFKLSFHFSIGPSMEMLPDAAEKAGMDNDTVLKDLEEGKGAVEVDREIQEVYKAGIHAVPNIVINRAFN
ncbi:hypothetical protein OIDMADRAFT_61596 [Oidiodendron maius Zn]|uniref:DSBA-like thioredoxin domain-containing protein n=1 Tax=Oidiodendron maius (strain Zn) TaxID=913774 RepID=A0A0C3C3G9_OIDMZ|nr:hypothetical protein OIDMADRAFT_61596 [Oidiodendron maius Zn]